MSTQTPPSANQRWPGQGSMGTVLHGPKSDRSTRRQHADSQHSCWQFVVMPPRDTPSQTGILRQEQLLQLRFDRAQSTLRSRLVWSTFVGNLQENPHAVEKVSPESTSSMSTSSIDVAAFADAQDSRPVASEAVRPAPIPSRIRTPNVIQRSQEQEQRFLTLLAEAAHDIRSPIAAASQVLNSLSNRVRRGAQIGKDDLALIDLANSRLAQASNWAEGILLNRRLEHADPVVIRSRFYPPQWLAMLQPLLEPLAAQRGIRINWVGWDRSLPRLYLDPNHLSRAVMNLATNAIQASRPGQEISIRVGWQHNVTQRLIIAIEDTGSGLPVTELEEINATSDGNTQAADGQDLVGGLGLKTAKSLVVGMGGAISAALLPQGGTLFRISLPIDEPTSLLRGWLLRNLVTNPVVGSQTPLRVRMNAIRIDNMDLDFADSQLQQHASENDMVYRVGRSRWLWMSIVPAQSDNSNGFASVVEHLNGVAVAANSCRAGLVFQTRPFTIDSMQGAMGEEFNLPMLAESIANRIRQLTQNQVPPLDDLSGRDKAIAVRPVERATPRRILRADQGNQTVRQSRLSKFSFLSGSEQSKLNQALVEIAQHWHETQKRLNRVAHPPAGPRAPIHLRERLGRQNQATGSQSHDVSGPRAKAQ